MNRYSGMSDLIPEALLPYDTNFLKEILFYTDGVEENKNVYFG